MPIIVIEIHFIESFLYSIRVLSISITDTKSVAIDAIGRTERTEYAQYADLVLNHRQSVRVLDKD